jgi:hypothetical protein
MLSGRLDFTTWTLPLILAMEAFSKLIELEHPVLRSVSGREVARFNSATLVWFEGGGCDLYTDPQSLSDDFPFHEYDRRDAPALYLESGNETYPVRVRGGLLEMA